MKESLDDLYEGPRTQKRQAAVKRQWRVAIVLITVVLVGGVLIAFLGEPLGFIQPAKKVTSTTSEQVPATPKPAIEPTKAEQPKATEDKRTASTMENVRAEITNESWQAIGTAQTEPHKTMFDVQSTDWAEMTKAASYAVKIPVENMTVWYISNEGENRVGVTVSAKNLDQAYRVFLQWEPTKGWKPQKIWELVENDKRGS